MNKSRTLISAAIAAAILVIGYSAHVVATTVTAQPIGAVLISPFTVTPVGGGLNFGTVSYDIAGTTTVDVDPTAVGYAASSSDGAGVLAGTGAARAQFDLASGQTASTYTVNFTTVLPLDISASGGAPAGSVTITALTWAGAGGTTPSAGVFDGAGLDTMYVGGTLQMTNAAVASAAYVGAYDIDVVYN